MLMKIWAVMAPVLACAGVGYFWGRTGRPFDTRTAVSYTHLTLPTT